MSPVANRKTQKELDFIQDLFIAPDWGERFASLIDEHVKLPKKGRLLYAGAGTGGHALALRQSAGQELEFLCIDENEECIELARAKALSLNASTEFLSCNLEELDLKDDQFDFVVGDLSLVAPERLPEIILELVRVTKPRGTVALMLATSSSFGEFFSIYWEALYNSDFANGEVDIESLLNALPTVSEVEEIGSREGLVDVNSWKQIEEFDYDSGEDFLNSPLISDFLMKGWLGSLATYKQERVAQEIATLINEERHNAEFSLTVKATLLTRKDEAHRGNADPFAFSVVTMLLVLVLCTWFLVLCSCSLVRGPLIRGLESKENERSTKN